MQQKDTKINVKQCPSFELYNFMQDLRHLMIIDTREDNTIHIRNSFQLDKDCTIKKFIEYIEFSEKKALDFEKKYNSKPIRRVVFYGEKGEFDQQKYQKQLDLIKQQDSNFRFYYLKEGFEHFQKKYSFLCLSKQQLEDYQKMKSVDSNEAKNRENLLTNVQKQVLFSHSQFPIEIYENQVYLGNIHHANSDLYLESLGIKTIIDFTHEHSEEFKKRKSEKLEKQYTYQYIPIEKNKMAVEFDFNEINEFIIDQIEGSKGPVLIFCKDGNSLSPVFAISWLMYQKGLQFQIASLKIFQYKGGVMDVCKNAYTQLMSYVPKK